MHQNEQEEKSNDEEPPECAFERPVITHSSGEWVWGIGKFVLFFRIKILAPLASVCY